MSAHREARAPHSTDAPPKAPEPAQPEHVVLRLQRQAGNAAVSRVLARAPVETEGHQEPSWARPSMTPAATPVHVATIHFRTKESSLDAQDLEVVKGLSEAYTAHARRNVGKPDAPQGVEGRIVGYADPRRSAGPDNQALSQQRADHTARALQRGFVGAARMIDGHFHFERVGAGVAPEAAAADAPMAEGNQLAPLRKAEIYLAGQATEPAAPPPKVVDPPEDKRIKPPDLDEWNKELWDAGDYGRGQEFDQWIERGLKREIEGMAMRIAGWTATEGSDMDAALFWGPAAGVFSGNDMPKVGVKEPPWWKDRELSILSKLGRAGLTDIEKLKRKARLLKRDYVETAKWSEIHFSGQNSTYKRLIAEVKKDNPDRSLIAQYVVPLEYLRFMTDAVQNATIELAKEARK